jgi:hypothetical protein
MIEEFSREYKDESKNAATIANYFEIAPGIGKTLMLGGYFFIIHSNISVLFSGSRGTLPSNWGYDGSGTDEEWRFFTVVKLPFLLFRLLRKFTVMADNFGF